MQKVIILGPAHPLRGGLATFNQRLAEEFLAEGADCAIVSFSLQYPSLFFPGKTQYSTEPPPEGLQIYTLVNTINPLNWIRAGRWLQRQKADLIVVRFWIPFIGPALGTILRMVRRNRHTRIICIADNVIPHERRFGDTSFTGYFLRACDGFVTMSEQVLRDLRRFEKVKPALLVQHPLYDNFGKGMPKEEARKHLGLDPGARILLFFGFIRKYKGLDLLLEAMADERIRREGIRLLVAGEFYEDEKAYRQLIRDKGIGNEVLLHSHFIPDSEVKYYLCAGDVVVQPYRDATQSGVTPLAYHFEKPMIVTNVGGLPDLVPHQKSGLVSAPAPAAIADAILQFYQLGEDYFIPHLRTEKQKYSWSVLVQTIRKLAATVQRS